MEKKPAEKSKILAEVLLEIRFNPPGDISLMVGNLNNELGEYPIFENLNVPDFPQDVPQFRNIAKFRFFSSDRNKLYNIGKGVLSVNTINYEGFKSFIKDVTRVLSAYKKISGLKEITRIGLRFINKIPSELASLKDYNIKIELPEHLSKISSGFLFNTAGKIDDDIFLTRLNTENPLKNDVIMFDLDYYSESVKSFQIEGLIKWMEKAHINIQNVFKETLSEKLRQSIK